MTKILINKIFPDPGQPRKEFDLEALKELSGSIAEHGLINPIAVEPAGSDEYILVDGERRWRAAGLAGLVEIEANILPRTNGDGTKRFVKALVANLQREDMNPIDTAQAYQRLIGTGLDPDGIAGMIHKHPTTVKRYLQMLKMPKAVQELYRAGKLKNETNGLVALMQIEDKSLMIKVATAAAEQGYTGLQVAALARRMKLIGKKRVHKKEITDETKKYDGHWNMIAESGVVVLDKDLAQSAIETCKECPLYNNASHTFCKDCPGVMLIRKLVERSSNDGH